MPMSEAMSCSMSIYLQTLCKAPQPTTQMFTEEIRDFIEK